MALRELLATFDIRVTGAEQLRAADATINATAKSAGGLGSAVVDTSKALIDGGEAVAGYTKKAWALGGSIADGAEKLGGWIPLFAPIGAGLKKIFGAGESNGLVDAIKLVGASFLGLGTARVTAHMWGLVESTIAETEGLSKLASTLGLSTKSLQEWQKATQASDEDLRGMFKTLAAGVTGAQTAGSAQAKLFDDLGVKTTDASDNVRGLEDVMLDVTTAIANTSDKSKQLALAQTLLGEGALKSLSSFKGTREEMEEFLRMKGELAGVFDEGFIQASDAARGELAAMRSNFAVLKSVIVGAFLPSFRWVVQGVTKAVATFRAFLKETGLVDRWLRIAAFASFVRISSLLATHWAMLVRWAGWFGRLLAPIARFVARFVAWGLVLDDIVTFLRGGNSLLGDFLDKIGGAGTANAVLEAMWGLWDKINVAISLGREVLGWLIDDVSALTTDVDGNATSWNNWGSGVTGVVKGVIDTVKELLGWLDKLTGWTDSLNAIGQAIFEATDADANARAAQQADWRAKDAAAVVKAGATPRAAGPVTNVTHTDNSKVSVVLQGPATPETVKTATREAAKLSNKGAQNAVLRGTP